MIRMRLSAHHAHYGGGLVDGAFNLQLFGDVATELLIRNDGDEGLFRAYDSVDFLAHPLSYPVHLSNKPTPIFWNISFKTAFLFFFYQFKINNRELLREKEGEQEQD